MKNIIALLKILAYGSPWIFSGIYIAGHYKEPIPLGQFWGPLWIPGTLFIIGLAIAGFFFFSLLHTPIKKSDKERS